MRSRTLLLSALFLCSPLRGAQLDFADLTHLTYPALARISPEGDRILSVVGDPSDEPWPATTVWISDRSAGSTRVLATPATNPRWSPDSNTIAFVRTNPEGRSLALTGPMPGARVRPVAGLSAVSDFEWAPDGRSLAVIAETGGETDGGPQIFLVDAGTLEAQQLTTVSFRLIVSPWDPEGNLSFSPDGTRIAFAGKPSPRFDDDHSSSIYVLALADRSVSRLTSRDGMNLRPEWSPDGRWVLFRSTFGHRDRFASHGLALVSPDGAIRDIGLSMGLGYLDGPYAYEWSPDSRSILFTAAHEGTVSLFRIALDSGTVERLSGPSDVLSRFTVDRSGTRLAFLHTDSRTPWRVAVASLPELAIRALPGLPGSQPPPGPRFEPSRVRWTAPDGLELEGLLFTPDAEGGPFPLLTFLHGGPEGQAHVGFVPEVPFPLPLIDVYSPQVYADRGWAVFLPNFRGSGGYGEDLRRAALEDWTEGFVGDIQTGIDQLVRRGIADPDRLVVGGSWRSGATKVVALLAETTRFRAATILSAYPDIVAQDREFADFHLQNWGLFGGSPDEVPEVYARHSPIERASEIRTPSMVVHDENDFFIPASQSERLHEILGESGVAGELILYRSFDLDDQAELGRRIYSFYARAVQAQNGSGDR